MDGYSFVNNKLLADIKLNNRFFIKKRNSVTIDGCIKMVKGGKKRVLYFN